MKTLFPKGINSNPEGVRTAGGKRALELADELAAEHGGWGKLTATERLLIEQAARLVALSEKVAKPDSAIRLASESRRALLALRGNRDPKDEGPTLEEWMANRTTGDA
jgi:hypothetical protein